MSVHYKFKSTLDYDTITFDGLHISVADLKKAILQQKRLSKITDFDLQIINAQTKEEYQHDTSLIPKNTSLIISRVPVANQAKKSWDTSTRTVQPRIQSKVDSADFDLSKMEGSEEDKIQAMMLQSTAEYDPKSYQKIRGYSQTGEVPATYRCNKCKKGGHWIKNCPYNISKEHTVEKRTTGIPKSFRDKDDRAMMIESQETIVEEDKKQEIPEDLICSICNDLFVDAVMIPCCGSSFCDDCVRNALLDSEDNECPDCKEKGSSPGSLIPNRFLRNSVNAFKNKTGYKASNHSKKEANQNPKETNEVKSKEEEKEIELALNEAESRYAEVEQQEDIKTNAVTEKEEEADTKPTIAATLVKEIPEQVAAESDELKHRTANTSNSPTHEDSDYEDNIVVTVPSASDTRTEKYLSRRHNALPKPPGIDQTSPKSKYQISPYQQDGSAHRSSESSGHAGKDWEHNAIEKVRDHHEITNSTDQYKYDKGRSIPLAKPLDNVHIPGANSAAVPLYPPHQSYDMQQQRPIRPINMHTGFPNHMHRPPLYPHPNMPPHHPPHHMRLPMPTVNSYDPSFNAIGNVAPGYQRFPSTMPNRFNYPIREAESQNQMRPFNNIASVYEEVAAKVGVGIIDDPLEAFNRIMKEKEKKKDERRSPDRRRRSKDRHIRGNFRTSPFNSRIKDHGYHDKRGRSRDRDNERKWPRYGKSNDKERERERERDRERDREHDREKNSGYRSRRSKSLDRNSRSRSHSPLNKRYRSPPSSRQHSAHEKHPHHYHQKFRLDEPDDSFDRQRRDQGRTMGNFVKSFESSKGIRQHVDNEAKNMDVRKLYVNDENSEPPPPGFEMHASRNPFHTNNITNSPLSANRERDRVQRNNTPDLYEKCVSQDMEENKFYNTANKSDQRFGSRSQTRSRSRSRSSLKLVEKRKKIHRSMTPKGKPCDNHTKRDKENALNSRSHSHGGKRKSEDRFSKKDKEANEYETKRRSMTPPRQKDIISEQNQTSSETDQKDKSESKKSEKKLKDRKKKRKEKSDRKKVKKEKKSKKERHRLKSEDNDNITNKDCGNNELGLNASNNIVENEQISEISELKKNENVDKDQCPSVVEKMLSSNSTPEVERTDSTPGRNVSTPNRQQPNNEYDKTTTPSDIKCFDAVLDIHEYETDFDDNNFKLQDNTSKFVPQASKWELEDQINAMPQFTEGTSDENQAQNSSDSKVTNDVIVRAEKAIFARAINAIRPLEVRRKSMSKEKSTKCYSDDHENIRNIQITLPVNISKERSIEVKNENNEKKKSIKDRLGSKISQPLYSQVGETRRESEHCYKSSYPINDRESGSERDRRTKSSLDSKVTNSNNKRSETERSNRLERDGDKRSHERDRTRDNKDKERGRDKERMHHREKDIMNKDKDKERDRDKDKNRERLRDHHRHSHDTESERKRFHSKSKDIHKILKVEKLHHSSERERREHDSLARKRNHSNSSPVSHRKRSPSTSNSDSDDEEHKRKHAKSDKKSRKRSDSPESDSGKKSIKKKNKSDKKKKKKSKK